MYLVTRLEPYNKKIKIIFENNIVFGLYKKEVKKYNITEGEYISEEIYSEICEEVLFPRAKNRALFMLGKSSKTKFQVIDKLKQGFYPEYIIEQVIGFLEQYDYINDREYVERYIEYKSDSRSIARIKADLIKKGISTDVIKECIVDNTISEEASVLKLIEKKLYKYDLENETDRRKLFQLLQRNGYRYETIINAFGKINYR